MTTLVSLLTFGLLSVSLFFATRELSFGRRSCVLILFPIHFVFCGLPLLLDVLVGRPTYLAFPGFHEAAEDEVTLLFYCLYMLLCVAVWWLGYAPYGGRTGQLTPKLARPRPQLSPTRRALVTLLLLAPFALVAISPDPWMYLEYTPRARELHFRDAERMFHIWVGRAIQASFLASAILLFFSRRLMPALAGMTPLVGMGCWLSGKRNAIATVLVLWLYSLWRRGSLRGRQLVTVSLLAGSALLAFSAFYQTRLRFTDAFVENKTSDFWYDNYRIDYGRDDTIKLNIFALLHADEMQILDYPGQSLEIVGTMWVPRRFWPEKPPPYPYFVTTAAMGGPSAGGGGVTTTVLGEALANFGWTGMLVGPCLLVLVCRIGDAANSETVRFLTLLVAIGMQTVHIAPWAIPAAAWFVLSMRELLQQQTPKKRVAAIHRGAAAARQRGAPRPRSASPRPRPGLARPAQPRPAQPRPTQPRPPQVSSASAQPASSGSTSGNPPGDPPVSARDAAA